MSRRIAVRAIIYRDDKLFGVRHRTNKNEGKDFWCTPGGGLDDGESLIDGARREILEETGVNADIGRLLFIQQYSHTPEDAHDYDEFLEFFFEVTNVDDFDAIDLAQTSHGQAELAEFGWVDPRAVTFLPRFIQEVDFKSAMNQSTPLIVSVEL